MANPQSPDEAPDRNLLFGILALQNNFIDREALLAAFAAWVVDKRRPLGEILCALGKLSGPQQEWLRGLMEQHVILHQGDPKQSLAAVSAIGSIRDDLKRLGDPQLEETLDFVARDRPESNFRSVSAVSVGEWSGKGQRFRVLRSHAKGGLGEVFVAEDLELRREVALKEIQLRHADHPTSRSRFLLEAEITGGLEHPGIVPVYGRGQYADGRPYYAMRFIRGDSMKNAIDRFHKADVPGRDPSERTLELRKLLGRFMDVCEAVEYAHSRGVLHRDLKPANIMLGNYGETLVVDWGLAKAAGRREQDGTYDAQNSLQPAVASGSEPTAMGAAIGTPAYMSPEQAAGRQDLVGTASDVYGLGATLFQLLTGQTPVTGKDVSEVLGKVQQGNIPSPRARNPRVPAALGAVCSKAMAKEPSDRYASPRMLAEDLEHWLADEPVSCLAEPLTVRAQRWMKRHRTLVSSSAAAVAVLVTSLVVLLALVAGHNQTLDAKNRQLDTANSQLTQANTDLQKANASERIATTKAEANATVAREQSQLALKSLEFVIVDIQAKLENVAGAGRLQRSLLQTALARLQEVSEQFAARSAIDRNTHLALIDLGDVFLRIGTSSGGPGIPDKVGMDPRTSADVDGPLTAARRVYQQAFEIAKKLAADEPRDAEAQRDLSVSYNKLGDALLQSGRVAEALGQYQYFLQISQKLAEDDPRDADAQRDLAVAHSRLGDALLQSGRVTEALKHYERDLEISETLVAAHPSDALALRGLCISFDKHGDMLLRSQQVNAALELYQRGLTIRQRLATANPRDGRAQADLAVSHSKLGDALLQSGRLTDAQVEFQKGLEINEKLEAADPSDTLVLRSLSTAMERIGFIYEDSGKWTDARKQFERMLSVKKRLAENDPVDSLAQRELSIAHEHLGDVLRKSGSIIEALGPYTKCLEICQKLAAADPSDAQAQRDLSVSHNRLGKVLLESEQLAESLEHYQKGLELRDKLAATDSNDHRAQMDLFNSHHTIAAILLKQKHYGQAVESFGRGLKVLQALKEQKRLAPADEKWIGVAERLMQLCRHAAMVTGDWKTLLEQPADVLPVLLEMRGIQFEQEGRASDAVQAVAKLRELGTATHDQLYNAACVYSLCATRIKAEEDELTAEQAGERQKHLADALATLREAIKAGYKDFAHLQNDPDLAPLRELPEFKMLLRQPEK